MPRGPAVPMAGIEPRTWFTKQASPISGVSPRCPIATWGHRLMSRSCPARDDTLKATMSRAMPSSSKQENARDIDYRGHDQEHRRGDPQNSPGRDL